MRYKATVSFSGKISMTGGEVREISDSSLAKDLLKAGYIIEHKPDDEKPKKESRRKTK